MFIFVLGWALRRFAHGQNLLDEQQKKLEGTLKEILREKTQTDAERNLQTRLEQLYRTIDSHITGEVADDITLHSGD